jgi:hypothetical protein
MNRNGLNLKLKIKDCHGVLLGPLVNLEILLVKFNVNLVRVPWKDFSIILENFTTVRFLIPWKIL